MMRQNAEHVVHLQWPLRSVRIVETTASKPAADANLCVGHDPSVAQAAQIADEIRDDEAEAIVQQQQLQDTLQAIAEKLSEVETNRRHSLGELQALAVELAMLATAELLDRVIERDEFPIMALIEKAILRLDSSRTITVRVHPQDFKLLQQLQVEYSEAALESAAAQSNPTQWIDQVSLKPDAQLERGSCLADGGDFGLLSTLDSRIAEIRQCFMEGLDHAQVERRATQTEDQTMRRFPNRRETA